jgi:hypothetical protein
MQDQKLSGLNIFDQAHMNYQESRKKHKLTHTRLKEAICGGQDL